MFVSIIVFTCQALISKQYVTGDIKTESYEGV